MWPCNLFPQRDQWEIRSYLFLNHAHATSFAHQQSRLHAYQIRATTYYSLGWRQIDCSHFYTLQQVSTFWLYIESLFSWSQLWTQDMPLLSQTRAHHWCLPQNERPPTSPQIDQHGINNQQWRSTCWQWNWSIWSPSTTSTSTINFSKDQHKALLAPIQQSLTPNNHLLFITFTSLLLNL